MKRLDLIPKFSKLLHLNIHIRFKESERPSLPISSISLDKQFYTEGNKFNINFFYNGWSSVKRLNTLR